MDCVCALGQKYINLQIIRTKRFVLFAKRLTASKRFGAMWPHIKLKSLFYEEKSDTTCLRFDETSDQLIF